MASLNFSGFSSVKDRTVFTNKGPIVKSPLTVLSGPNLYINSPNEINIPTGNFDASYVNKNVQIIGSPLSRNDGTYRIVAVRAYNILKLDANFDYADSDKIEQDIVKLANDIRFKFNAHLLNTDSHGEKDLVNSVTTPPAVSLSNAIVLLNEIKTKISIHSLLSDNPLFIHKFADPDSSLFTVDAFDLDSTFLLVNALRKRYEAHRQDIGIHLKDDFANRLAINSAKAYVGSGSMIGPFNWEIQDPRYGVVADDPSDVSVLVNGNPADVDYVFGLLGAVVLTDKPNHGDSVLVDYKYLKNPPTQFERLNSFEFVLNQEGNNGYSGVPGHLYRQRSYLINPGDPRLIKSPFSPRKINYKYKAYENKYTAKLNDPSSLLLNSPTNRIMYSVFNESVFEYIIRYDPVVLPNNAIDPWVFYGEGVTRLTVEYPTLIIEDTTRNYSSNPGPPFYSHSLDLRYPSFISAAYRFYADYGSNLTLDGEFNGVGFGFTDGQKAVIVGGLLSDANNLSSAIFLCNDIKNKYSSHIDSAIFHRPKDNENIVLIVDAYDLDSLLRLTNHLVSIYNSHIVLGSNYIHKNSDFSNSVTSTEVNQLEEAILRLNELKSKFNTHRSFVPVHYNNDNINIVDKVKQVGVFKNEGFLEEASAWQSFAYNWTVETTYRLYITPDGNASIFLSGDVNPRTSVDYSELPNASDLDLQFDPVYQTFFGALGDASSSKSYWRFSRIDVLPINSLQILKNKQVSYTFDTLPEYTMNPWITVGQGGTEYLLPVDKLQLDSTSFISNADAESTGKVTGEYRGYLRIEPSLTDRNVITVDFSLFSPFYSFGVDNRSLGVHIGDGTFATQLCFLQANPSPAHIRGLVYEGAFSISTGDTAVFSVDNGHIIVVTSPNNIITVNDLVVLINSQSGLNIASVYQNPYTLQETIQFTSINTGSGSNLRIISGPIFDKLGIPVGIFIFGSDTQPEYKFGYTGLSIPNFDDPTWLTSGSQKSEMLERTLVITDNSVIDFRSYTQSNPLVVNPVIIPNENWKVDFRFKLTSFESGNTIVTPGNYKFCGALVNLDEGPNGKNLELHLSISPIDEKYAVIYSFNNLTNTLEEVAAFGFNWGDNKNHSYSIYTDKVNDNLSFFIDGAYFGSFTYSGLKNGSYGPSLTFGSGGSLLNNGDLASAKSTTEWNSLCVIHDSTVGNSYLQSQRFMGLYRGGPIDRLSSYYLSQVDWKQPHSYRILRDPISGVSVYLDNSAAPVISASFDVLTLPLSVLDFLSGIVPSGNFIAFGSFNQQEISRSIWLDDIKYSIGKLNDTNGFVPPHQVLNQSNLVSSYEHLKLKSVHSHHGFSSYSEGTPTDDLLASDDVQGLITLGEGIPLITQSQNIPNLGGLVTDVTPSDSIAAASFIFQNGQVSNFSDDLVNVADIDAVLSPLQSLNNLISETNILRLKYLDHISKTNFGVFVIHQNADLVNDVVSGPVAPGDLSGLINCLKDLRDEYNSHRIEATVHYNDDTFHEVVFADPTDLESCINSHNLLSETLNLHIKSYLPHRLSGESSDKVPYILASLNLFRDLFHSHMTNENGNFVHKDMGVDSPDTNNANFLVTEYVNDISQAFPQIKALIEVFNFHLSNKTPHDNIFDITNTISLPYPNGIDDLYNQIIILTTKFNDHLSNTGGAYHDGNDIYNIFAANANIEYLVRYLYSARDLLNIHVNDSSLHNFLDDDNQYLNELNFLINGPKTTCNPSDYCTFANELKEKFINHFKSSTHLTVDFLNVDFLEAQPNAVNLNTAMDLVTSCLISINQHNQSLVNELQAHNGIDDVNEGFTSISYNPLSLVFMYVSQVCELFNQHIDYKESHVKTTSSIQFGSGLSLQDSVDNLNILKSSYNDHLLSPGIHVRNDTANAITSPDASDLGSLIVLLNETVTKYNQHRIRPGVHSSTAIIKLSSPPNSLYDGLKIWTIDSGTPNLISSFSDDETYKIHGLSNSKTLKLNYSGVNLPENISICSVNTGPFPLIHNTYLLVYLNYANEPVRVIFTSSETTGQEVVDKINNTSGIPLNFASLSTDQRITLTNPTSGAGTSLSVDGTTLDVLGFRNSQPIPWALYADDSTSVSVGVVSSTPDYLSYTTTGTGTKTAYVNSNGLTDSVSLGFSIKYKIKLNTWSYDANGETGIFIGCSGKSGPGFTVGLGFGEFFGNKTVYMKDMNSGKILASKVFNWADGVFHEYIIERSMLDDSIMFKIKY